MNPENVLSAILQGNELEYVLFKLAIDFAERGCNVWFISREPFTKVPKNIEQPEKDILQKITFIYLTDYNEVLTHLNSTHTWHKVPSIIILKDFDLYCNLFGAEYHARNSALLATILLDSASSCSRKKQSKTCVMATVSECQIAERLQVLYDMYFEKLFSRESEKDNGKVLEDIKSYFFIN